MSKEMNSFRQKDVILKCEPFVHVLTSKEREDRCEQCFQRQKKLLKCSACKVVRYCDKSCQRQCWDIHKLECKCFQNVAPKVPTESVRVLLRLILKYQKGHFKSLDSPKLRCFDDFLDHLEDMKKDEERIEQFMDLQITLRAFVNRVVDLPPLEYIFLLFARMCINSFSITDGEMQPMGVGIYLSASILDHSCHPDAVVTFTGTTLEVRALRDIPHADISKVRISYIELLAPREERRAALKRYYFRCDCTRCLDDNLDDLMLCSRCTTKSCEEVILSATETCPACKAIFSDGYRKQKLVAINRCKEALKTLKDNEETDQIAQAPSGTESSEVVVVNLAEKCLEHVNTILPPRNIYVVNIREKLFDAFINLGQWEKALECGSMTREPQKTPLLPECSHNDGIHLMKIGKIQLYLQHLEGALQSLQEAETILDVTLGKSHPKYRELMDLINESQEEMRVTLEHSDGT
ncbi:histone-lysine N-methyltransferase SMYD3-like [Lineus longissimus]|uniref:histone-lysine N-methyltransferase SMYD3-like n=1 Tax=Lineus longissimus TaxID=88925 RepID=UPI00315D8838